MLAAGASAAALALSLAAAFPATAGGGGLQDTVRGQVVSASPLNIRTVPSTDSQPQGASLRPGASVIIDCKVRAQVIGGNQIWYRLRLQKGGWAAARYIRNSAPVPFCWTPPATTLRLVPSVG
ncbi:SH3 domain-containing protein [Streptomyces sp. FIT100]|uniref:SH3 domain-containing protein n=1 Tax=Streptomyces sp. FIT100 TaxID=2837956 RepID=UPI0021C77A7F|nr:SH3 domain-containing protein [Streptomyces sp. FIT100]UUN30900.1 SH3 domain-containing protein [Streptomyces sp. FIT100]UUN30902.1 SH3 domain-containing protein [Streptomyces sp. FIT100]